MSKSVTAVEASKNRKTGPCSATYSAQVTCPPDCPLMGEGCYAEAGRVGITTRRLNDGGGDAIEVAHEEAAAIDTLSGLLDLRLHVVGDCATDEAARIVSGAAERFEKRARHTDVWTYTHAWKDVKRESWGGVSVLASCHSEAQVHEAMDKGYATCMTVEEMPEKAYKRDGVTYIPCLEQTRDTPCVQCRLCFKDKVLRRKKLVVLFALHTSKKKATAALRRGGVMKVRRVTHYEWGGKEYRSCWDAAVARGESTLTAIVGHGFGNAIIRCWNDGAREPVSGSQSGTLTTNKEER